MRAWPPSSRAPAVRCPAGASNVALLAVATHKASRLPSKHAVTNPLRAPFTRYEKPIGAGKVHEQVHEDAGQVKHAIGELVSCPFCLSMDLPPR